MGVISINYDNAMEQAKKLEQAAQDCEKQAGKIDGIVQRLEGCWKGNSGNAIVERFLDWKTKQQTEASRLYEEANKIRTVAENIRQADEIAAKMNSEGGGGGFR